jgi:murein DD-endopeptidase MepM/ murein hydrolase activator NlpD
MCAVRLAVAVILAALTIGVPSAAAGGGGISAPAPGTDDSRGTSSGEPGGGGGMAPPGSLGAGDYRVPLDVDYQWGDGFGAGRNHEGQDLFAECGSPILAARAGRVQRIDFQTRAGNYLVIDGNGTKVDTMYAHMLRRPALRKGARVDAGQEIGQVGSSGNASGCHLHFEIWTAPGWYEGGHPMPNVGRLLHSWAGKS